MTDNSPTAVFPPRFNMSVVERQTLLFDAYANGNGYLLAGQTINPASVVVTMTAPVGSGIPNITLSNAFTAYSTNVTQHVDGVADALIEGITYRLRVVFACLQTGDRWGMDLMVHGEP